MQKSQLNNCSAVIIIDAKYLRIPAAINRNRPACMFYI